MGRVALMICVLLFLLLRDGPDTRLTRLVLYGGMGLVGALSTYVFTRRASLRREQRRHIQDEYRRLVSNQRMH